MTPNKVTVMRLATAIADHELQVFGDHCLITNLTRIIREELTASATPKRRYCGPCDEYTNANPCPKCGADTDKVPQ